MSYAVECIDEFFRHPHRDECCLWRICFGLHALLGTKRSKIQLYSVGEKNLSVLQKKFHAYRVSKPRSDGQVLVAVAFDEAFLTIIDRTRGNLSRSAFIREQLAAALGVPKTLAGAPNRTGKGGRPKKAVKADNRADLERQRRELQEAIKASEKELGEIMERVSTPEAQDAIMDMKDKGKRIKTLENLENLKNKNPQAKRRPA